MGIKKVDTHILTYSVTWIPTSQSALIFRGRTSTEIDREQTYLGKPSCSTQTQSLLWESPCPTVPNNPSPWL